MRGGDCRRQPVRALLAGARASTRRACSPGRCRPDPLSRRSRRAGPVHLPNWLPRMGSHHHSRIQNPESCLLDDTAKSVPGRNCTCGLKVRNLAFSLLNYGDEIGATARTCTRLPPIPRARIAFYASAANCGMPVTLRPIHVGNVVSC